MTGINIHYTACCASSPQLIPLPGDIRISLKEQRLETVVKNSCNRGVSKRTFIDREKLRRETRRRRKIFRVKGDYIEKYEVQ